MAFQKMLADLKYRKSADLVLRMSDVDQADKASARELDDDNEVPSDEEGHSMMYSGCIESRCSQLATPYKLEEVLSSGPLEASK